MTNKTKREKHYNGSQKGKPTSDAVNGNNVMAAEELQKAISPTGGQNTHQ
jgi:hypothetical protein